ncbi:hypothetical protein GHT06_019148 [Daphnia sinensis]|uniref:HIG1 domain-containing protein n=1 Tax=Daphnia sinensis TaxID=1820382 RepID=A0AAD5LA32_9CRUS|nr:hypothetical protein GHT06_019148 [Daphnia sinensis]
MVVQRSIPAVDLSEETQAERLARKTREAPYVPIGLAGCLGAVLYGLYQYKNRGEMSTSVYVMKFRVVAQSAVVVTLGLGVGYSMIDKYILPKFQTSASKKEEPSA